MGTFGFDAGKNNTFRIALSNRSAKTGQVVTADAIKIGGGMGNIARRVSEDGTTENRKSADADAPVIKKDMPKVDYPYEKSGYPRFCEGARYWLQWAGIPDSVYSESHGKNDYTDDYRCRGVWVNYLAGGSAVYPEAKGLNIPIDLSFAFHTDAGTTLNDSIIGTLGIYQTDSYNGVFANGASRYLSHDLTDLVQSNIVRDIRTLYEPQWTRRGKWNQSYYEARVPRVPAMLLELLSHQNFADMDKDQVLKTVEGLKSTNLVEKIYLLAAPDVTENIAGCNLIHTSSIKSSATIRKIAGYAAAEYTLVYTKYTTLQLGMFALERMIHIAEDSKAGMVYADHYQVVEGKQTNAPVIDYQLGSLRDDFDFGSLLLFSTDAFKEAAARITEDDYEFAGLYDLRLKISQKADLIHINEYLYSEVENDIRKSGEKIFDYVDPKNREAQIEMEDACTEHLKEIGGYLAPYFEHIEFSAANFEYEASVIIPVRNRIRTIRDAIKSVLNQKTDFKFNLIVIDNHSTDGTTEAIDEFASDVRLVHIIPERNDLGIGGCWNMNNRFMSESEVPFIG